MKAFLIEGTTQKKRSRRSKSKKVKAEIVEEESEPEDEEEDSEVEEKDFNCQKCGQADHPEWILLCDRCDGGWHANCVRPALMVIPEGNWFCPPCDHVNTKKKSISSFSLSNFPRFFILI